MTEYSDFIVARDQFISWLDGVLTHYEHLPAEAQIVVVADIKSRVKELQKSQEPKPSSGSGSGSGSVSGQVFKC